MVGYVIEQLNWDIESDTKQVVELLRHLSTVGNAADIQAPLACMGGVCYPRVFVARTSPLNEFGATPITLNKIVGAISVLIEQKLLHGNSRVARIEDLVVHPAHRKNGIAKALVDKAIDLARKCDCYKITLDCNSDLVSFYRNLGFEPTDTHMRMNIR